MHAQSSGNVPRVVIRQVLLGFTPGERRRLKFPTSLHAAKLGLRQIVFGRPILTTLRIMFLIHRKLP